MSHPSWNVAPASTNIGATAMATNEQIKALIRSFLEHDEERFYSVSLQVAAHAARQGHGKAAEEIRVLIDEGRQRAQQEKRPVPIATPRGELAGLLAVSYPKTRLADMVLDAPIADRPPRE